VLDQQNFRDVFRSQLVRERRNTLSNHQGADRARRVRGDFLRRRQRFKAGVVPLPLPLLGDDKNFHLQITLASNFSFSTSFAATSFGVPVKYSVFFVFVGT